MLLERFFETVRVVIRRITVTNKQYWSNISLKVSQFWYKGITILLSSGINFVGTLKETTCDKKCIIVATEYETKWAEAKAESRVEINSPGRV